MFNWNDPNVSQLTGIESKDSTSPTILDVWSRYHYSVQYTHIFCNDPRKVVIKHLWQRYIMDIWHQCSETGNITGNLIIIHNPKDLFLNYCPSKECFHISAYWATYTPILICNRLIISASRYIRNHFSKKPLPPT